MLSRLVITFLPRSKCLLISCLQSPSAVILEPKKIKESPERSRKIERKFVNLAVGIMESLSKEIMFGLRL